MAAPVVALTSNAATVSWTIWRDMPTTVLAWSYVAKVVEAGGSPMLLPPIPEAAHDVVSRADALLLTGGADIDPSRYGAVRDPHTLPPDRARDRTELAALEAAQRRGIPVLGICRGMQLLAVARGGTLRQDLPTHRPAVPGRFEKHHVRIEAGTRLAAALGVSTVLYCHHHQGVDRLRTGLVATAWAEDGELEAIEDPASPFVVGVQAHPEEGPDTAGLFTAFVEAARQR